MKLPRLDREDRKERERSPFFRNLGLAVLTLLLTPLLCLLSVILTVLNLEKWGRSPISRWGKRRTSTVSFAGNRGASPFFEDGPPSGPASIIILNWNGKELLAQGIPSVIEAVNRDRRPHEILVVDNGSSDGSVEYVRATFPQVRILELPENRGFAQGNNAGVREARHDIVVLLNNDMIVDPGFLTPLIEGFGPKTFAVSSQIRHQNPASPREETGNTSAVYRRGFIDFSHRAVESEPMSHRFYPAFWAGGGSAAFHRRRFLEIGGFQEIFSPAYVEDTDLSFQAWKAGWDVLFAPESIVYHKRRASSQLRFTPIELQNLILRNQFLFLWKNIRSWRLLLAHCAFLPWNCYRLARDHGAGAWRSVFQASCKLPALFAARKNASAAQVRNDRAIFKQFKNPSFWFSHSRGGHRFSRQEPDRILWMTPYLPYLGRHAGAGRMYHLLSRVARCHRVTLLSFLEDETERSFVPQLESMCEEVIVMPRTPPARWQPFAYEPFKEFLVPKMQEALQRCLGKRDYDLIQLEYTQMAEYADQELGIPTLLTKHEVDFAAWLRRAKLETNPLLKLRWYYNHLQVLDREVALTRRVDAAICMTEPDRVELIRFCNSVPVHVLNTGVDLDYFKPAARRDRGNRLIFVGAFQHEPNVDAMIYFCRDVLPRVQAQVPDTELVIVGSHPPRRIAALADIPGVQVTGYVPDIRLYMAQSSVYVVPLRLGVGIRGKILEAWGMAMPVVATSIAGAGLHSRDGENLMIADTAEDFAAGVVALLKDPSRAALIGQAGRMVAEQLYGWDAIAAQLEKIYASACDVSGAAADNRE